MIPTVMYNSDFMIATTVDFDSSESIKFLYVIPIRTPPPNPFPNVLSLYVCWSTFMDRSIDTELYDTPAPINIVKFSLMIG